MTAVRDLERGARVADYRVEAVLGRGGMSVVYLAEDLRLKRRVALKLLAPTLAKDEHFRERFLRESELAASLDDANVIPIYEAGEAHGSLFIAMRYVEGCDLRALLRDGPLADEQTVALVAQVAGALDTAHERGLVHGDVKPSNVLIDGRGHAYLADFGLTKRLTDERSPAGEAQLMGTIDYIAPEQIRGGAVDGRADVYSLGCLLYECLTGKQPFQRRNDASVLYAHLEDTPPSVDSPADPVIQRALAKSPEERYETCHELADAVREALGVPVPGRTRLRVAISATVAAAGVASFLIVLLLRGGGEVAPQGELVRIDPGRNRVVGSVAVGPGPTGVAAGAGSVWVSTDGDSSVWRVDTGSLDSSRIPAHGSPIGIAANGTTAYVAVKAASGYGDGYVTRIDAKYGQATDQVATDGVWAIASGPAGVWVTRYGGAVRLGTVSTFTGELKQKVAIPDSASWALPSVAVGAGAVWVLGDALGRHLWRIDPAAGRVIASISLPFAPASVAAGPEGVWITAQLDDEVARVDPATNRIAATIRVGREPLGVAVGEGAVWIANTLDGTLTRIDPRSNRVVATIPVGGNPRAIAAGGDSVWVGTDER